MICYTVDDFDEFKYEQFLAVERGKSVFEHSVRPETCRVHDIVEMPAGTSLLWKGEIVSSELCVGTEARTGFVWPDILCFRSIYVSMEP